MSDEERAREIVVNLVRQMRVTGADAGSVLAVALQHLREARAEEREACAGTAECFDLGTPEGHRIAAAIRGRT